MTQLTIFDLDGNIAWMAVIGAGMYLGFAAGATYEAIKNPTPSNVAWAAVAWIPGAGLGGRGLKTVVKGAAPKMITKAVQYGTRIKSAYKTTAIKGINYLNKKYPWTKNLIRMNNQRLSLGTAPAYRPGGRSYKPKSFFVNFHVHMERGRAGGYIGKKCFRLWGGWKC